MRFKNKTVIVTGASGGIGASIAQSFGKEGANVIVNYNHNKEGAEAVANSINTHGGKALIYQCNIADFKATADMVKTAIDTYGRIDILINNSGITKDQLMLRMTEEDFDDVINVNLKGSWNMIKHVSRPMLKARQGRIINISSVVGAIGNPGQTNYVASKAGVVGMTKSLAKEFGKKQVTVNAVAPGFIETQMTNDLPPAVKNAYLSQIPLNRLGNVTDIAKSVLFLASDDAAYITGQVIHVNGGML